MGLHAGSPWEVIPENHGGGAHERDEAEEVSCDVCVEKPAATVGSWGLVLLGASVDICLRVTSQEV